MTRPDPEDFAPVARFLAHDAPDNPVLMFRRDALRASAARFVSGFPGQVTYAVKANPAPEVLRTLAQEGISGFDVASPREMSAVREAAPQARLHYHNPVRSRDEIRAARRWGVASWSVDRFSELDKLGALPAGAEVAVRLSLTRGGAAYDFGSKFGAPPALATELLRAVAARGMTPSITFHPGTQCTDAQAWADYIAAARGVARDADVTLATLNVGGGFPSLVGGDSGALSRIFTAIAAARDAAFGPRGVALCCEPGRAMVADCVWLLLRVKSVGSHGVTLNDGVYGALGEWRDMAVPSRLHVLAPDGTPREGAARAHTVFGPTCDSLDRLPQTWDLPGDMAEEDYILIEGAGAYTRALVTQFNGYGAEHLIDLADWQGKAGQHRLVS